MASMTVFIDIKWFILSWVISYPKSVTGTQRASMSMGLTSDHNFTKGLIFEAQSMAQDDVLKPSYNHFRRDSLNEGMPLYGVDIILQYSDAEPVRLGQSVSASGDSLVAVSWIGGGTHF
mmetsp:Transcript_56545/g.149061  ORF Transcript_56545/g.149061 Transcript_56545/m.149061 type:complete len:119 (-) Transcript_56545:44-400(-)